MSIRPLVTQPLWPLWINSQARWLVITRLPRQLDRFTKRQMRRRKKTTLPTNLYEKKWIFAKIKKSFSYLIVYSIFDDCREPATSLLLVSWVSSIFCHRWLFSSEQLKWKVSKSFYSKFFYFLSFKFVYFFFLLDVIVDKDFSFFSSMKTVFRHKSYLTLLFTFLFNSLAVQVSHIFYKTPFNKLFI